MPLIGVLSSFTDGNVITAAPHNANWTDVKNAFNNSAVLTDVIKTITVNHIWSAAQTFSGGATFGAPLLPAADATTDVGSVALRFRDGFFSRALNVAGLDMTISSGSFIPSLKFGGAAVGMTYAANGREGRYIKIGKLVIVWVWINLTAKGSSTGAASITDLPFAAAVTPFPYPAVAKRFAGVTYAGETQVYVDRGSTEMRIEEQDAAGVATSLTHAALSNSFQGMLTAVYSTD